MPTIGKLASLVVFTALALWVSETMKLTLPEGRPTRYFTIVNVIVAAYLGWKMAKTRFNDFYSVSLGSGITITFCITVVSTFLFAFAEMVKISQRGIYDGPVDAVVNVFQICVDWLPMLMNPTLIAGVIGGGAIGGIFVEWVNRRFGE